MKKRNSKDDKFKIKKKKEKEAERKQILDSLKNFQLSENQMSQLKSIKEATSGKDVVKKIKKEVTVEIEEEQIQQVSKVNIFQTQFYESENKLEQVEYDPYSISKLSENEKLEIAAKKLIPELTLQTFDKKKQKVFSQIDIEINADDVYDLDPALIIHYDELLKDGNKRINCKIERLEEQEKKRQKLPIFFQENEIIEAVNSSLVTIISGETGCGKSTQVPQFLYEAGFAEDGLIGVTQPRRLAAISLAKRVAEECQFKDEVSFQVKHLSSSFSEKTKIKFMTDGILINELTTNALLPQYSVIIIDEAHERKVNIDILIGVLSRIIILRAKLYQEQKVLKPLRLIIMSATLRLEDFTENKSVFPRGINLIKVPARQFPVVNYFNKNTPDDYVEAAIEKCLKIHKKLPPGDILIFLTGQNEIKRCCKLLSDKLERANQKEYITSDEENDQQNIQVEKNDQKNIQEENQFEDDEEEEELIQQDPNVFQKEDYLDLKSLTKNLTEQKKLQQEINDAIVYPLYSKLEYSHQQQIFNREANSSTRMIVVSTNVAETSLTIPTIRYVIDCGKVKKKHIDEKIGLEKHFIEWISQASSNQRSGRAGRTGPGYCYRLYSSAVYSNIFLKHNTVEITECPLDQVILQMKNIGIRDVFKFPFLTSPPKEKLVETINTLIQLSAVKKSTQLEVESDDQTLITELGKVLASIPLNPKFGKLLLEARQQSILVYGLLLIGILSVEDIIKRDSFDFEVQAPIEQLVEDSDDDNQYQKQLRKLEFERKQHKIQLQEQKSQFNSIRQFLISFAGEQNQSDVVCLINIVGEFFSHIIQKQKKQTKKHFQKELYIQDVDSFILHYCNQNHLTFHSLREIHYNLNQILEILESLITKKEELDQLNNSLTNYSYPTKNELEQLIKLIIKNNGIQKVCHLQQKLDVDTKKMRTYYQAKQYEEEVLLHPTSILFQKKKPEFLVYQTLMRQEKLLSKSFLLNVTACDDLYLLYQLDNKSDEQKKLEIEYSTVKYDSTSDRLVVQAKAVISDLWEINYFMMPYPTDHFGFYSGFAQSLLNGSIIDFFKSTQKLYKFKVNTIKETNMQLYSQSLITELKQNNITTKNSLNSLWQKKPSQILLKQFINRFLLKEFLLMIQNQYHENIKNRWPPLDKK